MGSSLFSDEERVEYIENVIEESGFCVGEVVCGGASGADEAGRVWALNTDVPVVEFDPSRPEETQTDYSWDEDGSAAGPKRNTEMVKYADRLIAIWDGSSPGTRNVIETAQERLGDSRVFIDRY
jgi:hypothetical protein